MGQRQMSMEQWLNEGKINEFRERPASVLLCPSQMSLEVTLI
jgi:hypothetical protein